MQAKNTIFKKSVPSSPFATLRAGDSVLVWDGVKEKNLWQTIADIVERDGRYKIRVEGTDFYFDEGLVVNFSKARETDNVVNFPVSLLQSESGSIGIFGVATNCQQCSQPSGQLFNVGTATDSFYICYSCRTPAAPQTLIGQTFGFLRVSAIAACKADYVLLRCQCFCRTICNVKSYDLLSGRIISCDRCAERRA